MTGQAPIFIGGAPRSGTTLLRAIINTSDAIVCGPEARIVPALAALSAQVEAMHMPVLQTSYALAPHALRQCFATAINAFFEPMEARTGRRVAEKTPANILSFAQLRRLFSDSPLIAIVRDGRDVAASLLRRDWRGPDGRPFAHVTDPRAALQYWSDLAGIGLEAEAALGSRCLRIAYEDLVRAPKRTLTRLLRFAGVDFDKAVFSAVGDAGFIALERGSLPLLLGPVVTSRMGAGNALSARLTPPVRARLGELGYR